MSVTDSLCLSKKICVFYRQSVSVKTACVYHRQYVPVTDSLCLSMRRERKIWQRKYVSVTDSMCLSQTVCVLDIQYVSVPDSMCLSQKSQCSSKNCFCHRQPVFVTYSLCLSQKVFVCQSVSLSNTLLDHLAPDFYLVIYDYHQ